MLPPTRRSLQTNQAKLVIHYITLHSKKLNQQIKYGRTKLPSTLARYLSLITKRNFPTHFSVLLLLMSLHINPNSYHCSKLLLSFLFVEFRDYYFKNLKKGMIQLLLRFHISSWCVTRNKAIKYLPMGCC